MMVRPKHQRLVLIILAVAALLGAVLLAMWGLQDRAAYFVTPSDIASGKIETGRSARLGDMVKRGSVERGADGLTTSFVVTDGSHEIRVSYRGILPDLFREGSGVVAEGRVEHWGISYPPRANSRGNLFLADNILAKHDERYMPPQMADEVAAK